MTNAAPPRADTHGLSRIRAFVLFVLTVGIVGLLVHLSTSSSPATPEVQRAESREAPVVVASPPSIEVGPPAADLPDRIDLDDGVVPEGVTVFDDRYPAVTNLDAALLAALRAAATEARDDGIELHVNSGWRSPEYQEQLLREAIAEHGSAEEAARWVATAGTSRHVSGEAIDLGPSEATDWLAKHGDDFGLCQIYENEPWHFELRVAAVLRGCQRPYADPTQDPRMQ